MPRVDFYLLQASCNQQRELFVCRLVDKIWRQGHRVYIHTGAHNRAVQLDKLLWTYQDDSFVPHDLYPARQDSRAPIRIGAGEDNFWSQADVLINLSDTVPAFFTQVERVLEVLNQEPCIKAQGRERYRTYREAGFMPQEPIKIQC